eukprot:g517.t1
MSVEDMPLAASVSWARLVGTRSRESAGQTESGMGAMGTWSRRGRPVQCIETGEVFKSITSAARLHNVDPSNFLRAMNMGWKCKGLTFKYHEEELADQPNAS